MDHLRSILVGALCSYKILCTNVKPQLVSIEDSSGCKRTLSVSGVTVNVKKVKPTAKFYGKEGQRRVVTLENEQASLPMRLTGDGVHTQL